MTLTPSLRSRLAAASPIIFTVLCVALVLGLAPGIHAADVLSTATEKAKEGVKEGSNIGKSAIALVGIFLAIGCISGFFGDQIKWGRVIGGGIGCITAFVLYGAIPAAPPVP